MFIGTHDNKVDKKGRVSVPAAFRQALDGSGPNAIVAFPSFKDQTIEVWTVQRMQRLQDGLDQLDQFSDEQGDLAAPVVLGGKLFVTTYLPEASGGTCEAQEGGGRLYAVDVLNAKAVINFDGIGDDSNLSAGDRTYTLGGGIPSGAVPIFQEEGITLLIGTSAGGESVDPELGLPRVRTYWDQEQ